MTLVLHCAMDLKQCYITMNHHHHHRRHCHHHHPHTKWKDVRSCLINILQRLNRDAQRKQKKCQNFHKTLAEVCKKNPNTAESCKSFTRGDTGRPRLEHDQQDLMAVTSK